MTVHEVIEAVATAVGVWCAAVPIMAGLLMAWGP